MKHWQSNRNCCQPVSSYHFLPCASSKLQLCSRSLPTPRRNSTCRTCLLSHISCCFFCWQLRTRRNNLRWWPPCKSHGFHQEVCFFNFMKPPKKRKHPNNKIERFLQTDSNITRIKPLLFFAFLGREEANIRKQFSSLDGDHTEIGKFGPMDGSVASFLFLRLEPPKPLWIRNDNSGHQKIVAPKLFLGEGLKTKRTVVFRCFLGWSFQMPRCPRRASCDTDLLRRNDAKQSCTEYNNIHKSNKYNTSKGILVYSPIPRVSHVCVFPFGFPSIKMFVKVPTSGGFSEILSLWTSMEFWYTSSILRAEGMDALMMS